MFKWIEKPALGALGAVVGDPAMIAWAKGVLVAWSKTDGSLQSLAMNYGLDPQDLTPTWTQRDGIELNLFTAWWNLSGKKPTLPASPIVGTIAVAQLTDTHLTALTTWATQKGLSMPMPQPGAQPGLPPAPGAPQAAPQGWPAQLPWPPPKPPLWPAGAPWPPTGAAPGAPPSGWPTNIPWDPSKWLPPGWPTALPFPLPLPNWWQPSGPGTQPPPAEPPVGPQPQPPLPPAPTPKPAPSPAPAPAGADAKSGISVPLIIGGVAIAGIAALAIMTRRPAQLMENATKRIHMPWRETWRAATVPELKKHGAKMLNWHGGQNDPIYAVGSYHYVGTTHDNRELVQRAERGLWGILERQEYRTQRDRHELQNLIHGMHKIYPWLSAK